LESHYSLLVFTTTTTTTTLLASWIYFAQTYRIAIMLWATTKI